MIQPLWERTITTIEDGERTHERFKNIDEQGNFLCDQVYLLPVNTGEDGGADSSITCIRIVLNEGTDYRSGYDTIRSVLKSMECDPARVSEVMGLPEIMCGVEEDAE